MIWVHENSNPDQTIIAVATFMLQKLRTEKTIKTIPLLNSMKEMVDGAEYLFIPALDVLFLLGLIEYDLKTDTIQYIGK